MQPSGNPVVLAWLASAGRRCADDRLSSGVAAALAALLAVAGLLALPGMASATHRWFVNAWVYTECVGGRAAPSSTVRVVLRDADGTVRDRIRTVSAGDGGWFGCFTEDFAIEPGDRIVVRSAGLERSSRVPRLVIYGDRDTQRIRIHGPVGATLEWEYWQCGLVGPSFCDFAWSDAFVMGEEGQVAIDGFAIDPGSLFELRLVRASGDVFFDGGSVSSMTVRIGSSLVTGLVFVPGSAGVEVELWRAGVVVATGQATVDAADVEFNLQLRNGSGERVNARVGDRVVASFAEDADFVIPRTWVHGDASENRVWGRCFANAAAVVLRRRLVDGEYQWALVGEGGTRTDADGRFAVAIPLRHTDAIALECASPAGDSVRRPGRVTR